MCRLYLTWHQHCQKGKYALVWAVIPRKRAISNSYPFKFSTNTHDAVFLSTHGSFSRVVSGSCQSIQSHSRHDHGQAGVQQEVRNVRVCRGRPHHTRNGWLLLRLGGHAKLGSQVCHDDIFRSFTSSKGASNNILYLCERVHNYSVYFKRDTSASIVFPIFALCKLLTIFRNKMISCILVCLRIQNVWFNVHFSNKKRWFLNIMMSDQCLTFLVISLLQFLLL